MIQRVIRWRLILEEFSPKLIFIKRSKNIVADALSRLYNKDKIDNLNNTNSNNNIVGPTLESLSKNFALNKEDVLHPTGFKTIMRFQQKDKSLIEIAKEKPNDYSITQFHGTGKTYSLICKHGKIAIQNKYKKPL